MHLAGSALSVRKAFTISCKFSLMHVTRALTKHNQCAPTAAAFVCLPTADDQRNPNVDLTPPPTITAFRDRRMSALSPVTHLKESLTRIFLIYFHIVGFRERQIPFLTTDQRASNIGAWASESEMHGHVVS